LSGFAELLMMQGKFQESIEYFKEGIQKARHADCANELLRLLLGASLSFERIGDSGSSLRYFKEYSTVKDSLFNQDAQAYLANMQVLAELSKKESEISDLRKNGKIAKMSRNMILVISSACVLAFGLIIYGLRQKRKKDQAHIEKQEVLHQATQEKIQVELQKQKEKEEELTKELDFRSRALTTYTLNLVQKNGMMEEIKSGIHEILKSGATDEHELKKLIRLVDYSYSLDKDWDGFKTYFEQVHPDFFKKIKDDYPQVSTTELRLCALIRLSLSIKEAATVLNIAPDSVKVARHRIRKKLHLASDASITDFIMSI
jgi:DNA-binding CsgD family transcriptional regulator